MAGINIYLAVVKRHLEDVNMDLRMPIYLFGGMGDDE